MEDEIHLLRFQKLVKVGLTLLCPSEADVGSEVFRKALRMQELGFKVSSCGLNVLCQAQHLHYCVTSQSCPCRRSLRSRSLGRAKFGSDDWIYRHLT